MEQETKKKKLHILDKIFVIGTIIIPILAMLADYIMWYGVAEGGFPVCTILGLFPYGVLTLIILVVSKLKKIELEYCKLWIILFLPWLYIGVILIMLIIAAIFMNIFIG